MRDIRIDPCLAASQSAWSYTLSAGVSVCTTLPAKGALMMDDLVLDNVATSDQGFERTGDAAWSHKIQWPKEHEGANRDILEYSSCRILTKSCQNYYIASTACFSSIWKGQKSSAGLSDVMSLQDWLWSESCTGIVKLQCTAIVIHELSKN